MHHSVLYADTRLLCHNTLSLCACTTCMQVLSVLTRQGYRGPEVDVLLSLASQGGGENGAEQQQQGVGLLGQLSQSDAAVLLDRLTDVLAEVQDGA